MMNADTIQKIQDDLTASVAKDAKTDIPTAVLPDSYNVKSLEEFMATRKFFRGIFETGRISDFVSYLNAQNVIIKKKIFVDGLKAGCILDLGDIDEAGACRHKARLTLKHTVAFTAISKVKDQQQTQRGMAEFIENWSDKITAFDENNNPIELPKAIQAIRNLTMQAAAEVSTSVSASGQTKSSFEKVQAKAQSGKDTLPAFINFECNVAESLSVSLFRFRLRTLLSGENPTFVLSETNWEQELEQSEREFGDKLSEAENAQLFYGVFDSK